MKKTFFSLFNQVANILLLCFWIILEEPVQYFSGQIKSLKNWDARLHGISLIGRDVQKKNMNFDFFLIFFLNETKI